LMTANIVIFLRVRFRPRTGPGRLFLQSLWSQFPRDPEAIRENPRKNKRREEFPRRVRDL
jgi:hypothetical protein